MKTIKARFILILILIFFIPGHVLADESPLASYLSEALAHNEDIKAAKALFQAAKLNAKQSGTLPDPKLGVQYYIQPVETRTGPQEVAISLSQGVPWIGKLSLAKKISSQGVLIAQARLNAVELKVTSQVKQSFVEYGFNREVRRINSENLELLKYLESVARTKYAGGKLDYGDLLKIQVEMAKGEDQLSTVMDRTLSLKIRLNSLLGAADATNDRPQPLLPAVYVNLNQSVLLDQARNQNKQLIEANEKITKALLIRDLAKKGFYPDFNLSVKTIVTGNAEYGAPPDSGRDPLIAGITLNLPIFRNSLQSVMEQKEAEVEAAIASRGQLLRRVEADIEQGLFRYRNAERRRILYTETLLPKVKQQVEVALEAFQSGRLSLSALIDAEKGLLQFELAVSRAQADQAIEVSYLEVLTGVVLAEWEKINVEYQISNKE